MSRRFYTILNGNILLFIAPFEQKQIETAGRTYDKYIQIISGTLELDDVREQIPLPQEGFSPIENFKHTHTLSQQSKKVHHRTISFPLICFN
jgi:hypothetical protein